MRSHPFEDNEKAALVDNRFERRKKKEVAKGETERREETRGGREDTINNRAVL